MRIWVKSCRTGTQKVVLMRVVKGRTGNKAKRPHVAGVKMTDSRLKIEDDIDEDQDDTFRPAPTPGPGEHPLQFNYSIWFSRRSPKNTTYDQSLKFVASFASVEQFWSAYSHMTHPGDMMGHSDYHLFKEGIRPMWEDDANKMGGKWIIRLKKGLASRCWENLILAMLGEQFMVGEEICGAVVSVRFQDDILALWNRTASDQATTTRIRDTLKRVLHLPANTIMEYKTHTDSLKLSAPRITAPRQLPPGQLPL